MKHRNCLSGLLICAMPLAGIAQDSVAPDTPTWRKLVDLRTMDARDVLRAAAIVNAREAPSARAAMRRIELPLAHIAPSRTIETLAQQLRLPRAVDHHTCDAYTCVARAKDGEALYWTAVPSRAQYTSGKSWLGCQSTNDMLSTFERYDACRGIGPAR